LASRAETSPTPRSAGAGSPRYWPGRLLKHLFLLLFVFVALVPVYFMVANSFKTNDEYLSNPYGIPRSPTFSTLGDALHDGDLYRWLLNSFVFTAASVLLSTVIGAFAAYPIALMRWKPGPWLLSFLIALMVLPPIVLVVPLFQVMADAGQLNTYRGVIVIYTGLLLPFSTFLLASFFRTMPRDLLEAARLDGAGHTRMLLSIVLPLSLPALVTVATVQALWVWNEVLIAVIFLQSESLRTLMVGVTIFRSRYHLDIPLVMAGMLWATIPMVILYLVLQRFFIRGLTAGAVKG
jgi:ABC-type glycerol-3-phosphate transport system permease component